MIFKKNRPDGLHSISVLILDDFSSLLYFKTCNNIVAQDRSEKKKRYVMSHLTSELIFLSDTKAGPVLQVWHGPETSYAPALSAQRH